MFLDSHAHLTCDPVFENIDAMIDRAKKNHVTKIINVCTDKITLKRGIDLIEKYNWIYHIGATPPHDAKEEGERYFTLFEQAAQKSLLIAIGETGLDYYYTHSPKAAQQELLVRNFVLARKYGLPIVIHCREAFADLFLFAKKEFSEGKAVLHCFTGSLPEAERAIERGWLISFSGIITFKKSDKLRQVVKTIPLEHILIETDTPYLAPQSKRGQVNEPSFIQETAQTIATIKGISLEEVATATQENGKKYFQLP